MYKTIKRLFKTLYSKIFHQSDYKRWSDSSNLLSFWDERTKIIANMIPPNSRIMDCGAGKVQLKYFLDSSCTYIHLDLVDRGERTIICDLNKRPLPDFQEIEIDIIIFSGVLEYISDLPSLINWLPSQASICIISYACMQSKPLTFPYFVELFIRTAQYGWLNHFSYDDLIRLFKDTGLIVKKSELWRKQHILLFQDLRKHAICSV